MTDHAPGSHLMTALTTEHYTLQSARAATVAESNGRSLLFLSTLTGSTVALALVAQLDGLGDTFRIFALAVLPAVLALGLLTYDRLVQLALDDAANARLIGRIRSAYRDLEPALAVLLGEQVAASRDRPAHDHRHHVANAATAVSALVGVLAAVLVGVAASPAASVAAVTGLSVGTAALVVAALAVHQERRWRLAFPHAPQRRLARCAAGCHVLALS